MCVPVSHVKFRHVSCWIAPISMKITFIQLSDCRYCNNNNIRTPTPITAKKTTLSSSYSYHDYTRLTIYSDPFFCQSPCLFNCLSSFNYFPTDTASICFCASFKWIMCILPCRSKVIHHWLMKLNKSILCFRICIVLKISPPPLLFVQPKESSISKERQLMSKRSPSHAHTLIKNFDMQK